MLQNLVSIIKSKFFASQNNVSISIIESINTLDTLQSTNEKKELLHTLVQTLQDLIIIREDLDLENCRYMDRHNIAVSILLSWLWDSSKGFKNVEISLRTSEDERELYNVQSFFTDTESIEIANEYINEALGNDDGYTFKLQYIEDPLNTKIYLPKCDTGHEIGDWFTIERNCIDSNCDTYGTAYNTKARSLYLMFAEDVQKLVAIEVTYWCL